MLFNDIACISLKNFIPNHSCFYKQREVVGDVAILNSLPEGDEEMQRRVGELIMNRNKAIKVIFSLPSTNTIVPRFVPFSVYS